MQNKHLYYYHKFSDQAVGPSKQHRPRSYCFSDKGLCCLPFCLHCISWKHWSLIQNLSWLTQKQFWDLKFRSLTLTFVLLAGFGPKFYAESPQVVYNCVKYHILDNMMPNSVILFYDELVWISKILKTKPQDFDKITLNWVAKRKFQNFFLQKIQGFIETSVSSGKDCSEYQQIVKHYYCSINIYWLVVINQWNIKHCIICKFILHLSLP